MGVVKKNIFDEVGVETVKKDGKIKSSARTKDKTITGNIFDDELSDVKKKEISDTIVEPSPTGTEETATEFPLLYSRQKDQMKANIKPEVKPRSIFDPEPKKTIFDQSFLDRDIDKKFDLSLSNPNLEKPKDKFSLSNEYYDRKQQEFEQKRESAKQNVKRSPQSLLEYNNKRIAEINDDIKGAKTNLDALTAPFNYLQTYRSDEDQKKRKEETEKYQNDIASAQEYKNKLKQSVATQAAIQLVPASLAQGKVFDPRKLGRDIVKVADPEQEQMFLEAEKNGTKLPGITQANIERMGLDISKQFLQSQPQTDFVKQRLSEIEQYEKDFDTRNFELTAQRAREKIGVFFYKQSSVSDDILDLVGGVGIASKNRKPNPGSGFWGYSGKDIESAINDPEAGLTESEKKIALEYVLPIEKKLFFSTDIPGSGFFRSGKNAIERSLINTGNTVQGWFGDRNDADRAQDLLNDEIQSSRFRQPGENPTWKSELAYLKNKEKNTGLSEEEKAQKVDLEKYVDVRNGWSKFKDGTGDLTGQVIEMAVLTKGVGIAGKALTAISEGGGILSGLTTSAIGTALANETTGLFLTSYLNSYDSYKTQSLQLMPGEKNAANRDAYAKVMSAVEGLSERIFNDVKVLKGFAKGVAPTVSDITNRFINKEITQQIAREELQSALMKYAKPFGKEFIKSTGQESFEEAVVDWADGISQSVFGGQPFDIVKTGQQSLNTFLTTALYSGAVSSLAAHGSARQHQSQNAFMKSALVDMASNPAPYLKSVEDFRLSGQITQQEANEKIKLINSASKYLKEIPNNITVVKRGEQKDTTELENKFNDTWKQNIVAISERTDLTEEEKEKLKEAEDLRHTEELSAFNKQKKEAKTEITEKQLDYPEVSSYVVHRMNEGIIQEQLDSDNFDEALRPQFERQLKRSIEIRKGIIDNSIGVTPNIQEITDNPKKAEDLGILDANEVSPDQLIGTPFQKPTPIEQSNVGEVEVGGVDKTLSDLETKLPIAKGNVDGRVVRDKVPGIGSIESSLGDNYATLSGIREIPFSEFPDMGELKYGDKNTEQRTKKLADEIKESGEINPLIVVYDKDGAYILEGGHRFDALRELGAKSFPAKVVIDAESISKQEPKPTEQTINETTKPEVAKEYKDALAILENSNAKTVDDANAGKGNQILEFIPGNIEHGKEWLRNKIAKEEQKASRVLKNETTKEDQPAAKQKVRVSAEQLQKAQPVKKVESVTEVKPKKTEVKKVVKEEKPQKELAFEGVKRADAIKVYQSIREMDEPTDAGGLAYRYIAGGGEISPESILDEVTGSKDNKQLNVRRESIDAEVKARDYVKKGANSITEAAHYIWDELPEHLKENISDQDIRNALIDVVGSHNKRLDAANTYVDKYSIENNLTQPEREFFENKLPSEEEALSKWILQESDRTYENEQYLPDEEFINNTIDNYDTGTETADQQTAAEKKTASDKTTGEENSVEPDKPEKTIAEEGKGLADRIRKLKTKKDALQANIFGIPMAIYDGAIETIATAIELGTQLAEAIQKGVDYIRNNGGNDLQEQDFTKHVEDFAAGIKPKVKTTGEVVTPAKPTSKKATQKKITENLINDIGSNSEDVLLDSVEHRRQVASDVAVQDTAKQDKLKLELVQQDSNGFIEDMKDLYGKTYLSRTLQAISGVNKNRVDLDKILAVGIALENEINNIKDGYVDNNFNITRKELNSVYAKVQKLNVENARTSSKALNVAKTLYNNYDNTLAKGNILSPTQTALKLDIMDTVLNEDKIAEAADAHESGVQLIEEEQQAEETKKDERKPKKITEKGKVKAKINDILSDLKDQLKKLDC